MPVGQGRSPSAVIDQAAKLVHAREAPVAGRRPISQRTLSIRAKTLGFQLRRSSVGTVPIHFAEATGVFEPDEAGQLVGDRPVMVVAETGVRDRSAEHDFDVLPGKITWYYSALPVVASREVLFCNLFGSRPVEPTIGTVFRRGGGIQQEKKNRQEPTCDVSARGPSAKAA